MIEAMALKAIACFAIGSVPFAVVAMWGSGVDIRKIGSGNPGFNNVLRVSKPRAVLALIGDVGKGYLPVWLFLEPPADPVAYGWLYGFAAVFWALLFAAAEVPRGQGCGHLGRCDACLVPQVGSSIVGGVCPCSPAGKPPAMG